MHAPRNTQATMSTELTTIHWREPISTAHRRMEAQAIRHLPVIDDTGEVVGILSNRDVLRAMRPEDNQPDPDTGLWRKPGVFDPQARVSDYMSWPVKSVDRRTDLKLVARRMLSEKVSSLIVRDGAHTVGLVTTDDLIKVLVEMLDEDRGPRRWSLEDLASTLT
jgi:CBS domain-containing protein